MSFQAQLDAAFGPSELSVREQFNIEFARLMGYQATAQLDGIVFMRLLGPQPDIPRALAVQSALVSLCVGVNAKWHPEIGAAALKCLRMHDEWQLVKTMREYEEMTAKLTRAVRSWAGILIVHAQD